MAEGESKISYWSKKDVECPICGNSFRKEELLTGRGRLIAGELTGELHRQYEPSQKYGDICPLIYPVIVCPACLFAAYAQDFESVPESLIGVLEDETKKRRQNLEKIIPEADFSSNRGLKEGAASYFLAISCYEHFPPHSTPTIKRGISALRAAWIFNDLHRKYSNENYDYLAKIFYHKAQFFYGMAVEYEQDGIESLAEVPHLGPDLDKNYAHDGVFYLGGLLEYEYGDRSDPESRKKRLDFAKRAVARLFGMGKASKDKPSALLEHARELYERMSSEGK
ncbi:MAG: DUF2225 domain-containing protein [Spirochaetales bacterium]|nr:DUF2225 domain-containing protein [Spirochaetales bacterium]